MPDRSNPFGDILAHIWAAEPADDFGRFIDRVKSDRKPSNYTEKTNEELIIAAGIFRLCRWEIAIRIILGRLDSRLEQANDRANRVAGSFGPTTLAWLYFLHPDEALMRFFVGVNLELEEVGRVLALRTNGVKSRIVVMRFCEEDYSSTKAFLVAVAARRGNRELFTSYGPVDEMTDREQTAFLKILEIGEEWFNNLKNKFAVPGPQIIGLPLDQKQETMLEELKGVLFGEDIAHMARLILPILNGEELPETVYQGLRAEDNKKRWRRALTEGRDKDIELETMGVISPPEESLGEREQGAQAYDYAKACWGDQGLRYLDTLIATEGNVAGASKAAGVSRVTGHKWRTELRNFISQKNPAK